MSEELTVTVPDGVVLRRDEPLSRHVPLRLGGTCDAWVVVHHREALAEAIAMCREAGWRRTILGAGTRTVVRDGGLAGAVLRLGQGFLGVEEDDDGVWVGAATPLAWLAAAVPAYAAWRHQPGTLGASLAHDDGWDGVVDRVRYVGRGAEQDAVWGDLRSRTGVVFTAARLTVAPPHLPQPPDPASWFAPLDDEDPVGLLRDHALSGTRLRAVALPSASPGMFVNLGGATVKDLTLLQKSAVERVHQARGIKLQDRMSWLGRA